MDQEPSLQSILSDSPFSRGTPIKAKSEAKAEPEAKVEVIESKEAVETKVEAKTEPATVEKTEAKTESERNELGQFKEKAKEKEPLKKADVAAIIDDRRKRQAAEERAKKLEQELSALKGGAKPDFWDDPDKAVSAKVEEALSPLNERLFKLSFRAAQSAHKDDFDEAIASFMEAAEKDPRLMEHFRASEDPAEYAYSVGWQMQELAPHSGNIRAYRESLLSEYTGKLTESSERVKALEAEIAALKKKQTELDSVRPSLSKVTSSPEPKAGEDDEPDIKQIVRFKR